MPIAGKVRVRLNASSILDRTGEYDIYSFFLGKEFGLGRPVLSPFRRDTNPSFSVNIDKRGKLHHIDFGDHSKRGNCFDFVAQLYGLGYNEVLLKIDNDMNLGIVKGGTYPTAQRTQIEQRKSEKLFQVITRPFTREDLRYWSLYGIGESELRENEVYSVKKLFIDRKMYPLSPVSPTFGYHFRPKWKIYRPLSTVDKWKMNVKGDLMSGLHRITNGCDKVVVTKSKKDEILLAKFLPYVCSVQQENTVAINSSNISLLNSSCGKVFLNFDSDEVGVQTCKYYNQFGFGWINCPRSYYKPDGTIVKDFADLARYHGIDKVIEHFKIKEII